MTTFHNNNAISATVTLDVTGTFAEKSCVVLHPVALMTEFAACTIRWDHGSYNQNLHQVNKKKGLEIFAKFLGVKTEITPNTVWYYNGEKWNSIEDETPFEPPPYSKYNTGEKANDFFRRMQKLYEKYTGEITEKVFNANTTLWLSRNPGMKLFIQDATGEIIKNPRINE